MYRKYSVEDRLECVRRYKSGESTTSIGRDIGVRHHAIPIYEALYDRFGIDGLKDRPCVKVTYELKVKIVEDYTIHFVPLVDIIIKYGVGVSSVHRWVNIAAKYGTEALKNKVKPKVMKDWIKSQKPKNELERLQYENEYLRAENALLKKEKALVEEIEAQEKLAGRKSSRN